MEYQEFKAAVIEAAAAQGITEYELYYAAETGTEVSAFRHEIKEFSSSVSGGVCFRCLVGGHMGYASTEQLTADEAAALVRRAADNAVSLETEEQEFLCEGGLTYTTVDRPQQELPSADTLRTLVLAGQDALYTHPGVVDGCESEAFASRSSIAIYNSRGLDLAQEATVTGFVSEAVVADGEEKENDYHFRVAPLEEIDVADTAAKAVADASDKLGADVAPTGAYPVVFTPKAMASLLRTYAGVFSAEAAQKGLSRLAGKEGEVIAAPIVTLTDDPFYAENPMPMPFDAEGSPTAVKAVIEAGTLRTLLHNRKTAARAGCATTGNAAKAGYDGKVSVRPFTMVLAAGSLTQEELLQKAGDGVMITMLGGLHAGANPITGDFSLQSAGFLIRDGKKAAPVRSFTVAGNFYTLLTQITALSDTAELPAATSSTAFASPYVLVEGLKIAGK